MSEYDGDLGGALELMERRLQDFIPRGRQRLQRTVIIEGAERRATLRENLERQREELALAIGVLTSQLAKREAQLRELDRYPAEDPFKDGDSLQFHKKWPGGETSYLYVAVRVNDLWYVTGKSGPDGVSWEKFTAWLGLGVTDIRKVGATRKTPVTW